MKFLCPSCKAKYQIADEKVAGRSVRMKCRKCGFVIPLSQIPPAPPTVAPGEGEESPALSVPRAPLTPVLESIVPERPAPSPAAPASVAKPAAPPRRPTLADVPFGAPKSVGPRVATAAPAPAPSPTLPIPPGVAAPGVKPAPPSAARPVTKGPVPKPAVSFGAKPPGTAPGASAAKPGLGSMAKPAPSPAVAVAVPAAVNLLSALEDQDENDDQTQILKGGALADAFDALVGKPTEATGQLVGMPADEWFVGINDVPVGPIRLGEIRKRAMLGAVTGDSMVWRDGLEAWRPLKTFPELLAVLEESVSSVRAAPMPILPKGSGELGIAKGDDSFGAIGAASGITGPAVVTDDFALPGAARARSPVFAWLAIVVALAFGVSIGFVVFSKQKPPETIVKIVEVPAKATATPAAAAVDPQAAETPGSAASAAAAKARSGVSKATGTKATDADKQTTSGLSGLRGLSGLSPNGPSLNGTGPGSTAPSTGGQLDAAQTQSTVARYTGSVKRSCWQPALDARDPSAPTSARVMVTITVSPTGSVQNVTTAGDPRGYPGLATCIGARVRAWQFPATGGTTTVNVPFVFAAQ